MQTRPEKKFILNCSIEQIVEQFFNISRLEVEDDPHGCIEHGKGRAVNKDGCFGGIFI